MNDNIEKMTRFINSTRFDVFEAHCDDDFVDFSVHCSPQSGFALFESMIADIELPHKFSFQDAELDMSQAKGFDRETGNQFFIAYTNWYQRENGLQKVTSESDQQVVDMKEAIGEKLAEAYREHANFFEVSVWPEITLVDNGDTKKPVFTPTLDLGSNHPSLWLDLDVINRGVEQSLELSISGDGIGLLDEENWNLASAIKENLSRDFRYSTLDDEDLNQEVENYIQEVVKPIIEEELEKAQEEFRVEFTDKYGLTHKRICIEPEKEKAKPKQKKSSSFGFN
ncbi:hypothetical protein [Salinicola sp. MIT1003]|uniref:hypothetical protein n=1 Tax=Salinicola sp. MIT1003 TaxID=1882734 RepID=UPI0008DE81A8|nr:hypothetical protein [Salinicola sp. MIT1003]OHZ03001.1 hypothetical protein BC443_15030 [Salinicola sp. MIT1003]